MMQLAVKLIVSQSAPCAKGLWPGLSTLMTEPTAVYVGRHFRTKAGMNRPIPMLSVVVLWMKVLPPQATVETNALTQQSLTVDFSKTHWKNVR